MSVRSMEVGPRSENEPLCWLHSLDRVSLVSFAGDLCLEGASVPVTARLSLQLCAGIPKESLHAPSRLRRCRSIKQLRPQNCGRATLYAACRAKCGSTPPQGSGGDAETGEWAESVTMLGLFCYMSARARSCQRSTRVLPDQARGICGTPIPSLQEGRQCLLQQTRRIDRGHPHR